MQHPDIVLLINLS